MRKLLTEELQYYYETAIADDTLDDNDTYHVDFYR
jgi:hypothetical protein